MDPFTRLPPELIAEFILDVADFSAAQNIILASPRVQAVFQAQPTIIHQLVWLDSMTSLPEIRKLCLNISLIETSLVQFNSFDDYQEYYNKMQGVEYTEELSSYILHLGARTQRLACACLALIQENLVSALSKCEDPADAIPASDRVRAARKPFSFIEEYRVYSSIWHLQHHSALRKAATGHWQWDEPSLAKLEKYDTWDTFSRKSATETIWTVAALLSDLGLTPTYGHYRFQHEQEHLAQDPEGQESSRGSWTFPPETPLPFFASFEPLQGLPSLRAMQVWPWTWTWPPPPPPPKTPGTKTWHLTAEHRTSPPRQCSLFFYASVPIGRYEPPVSRALTDLRPWRRLGLPVFDLWRMHLLGLWEFRGAPGRVVPTSDGGFLEVLPLHGEARARRAEVDYTARLLALVGVSCERSGG